MAKRIDLASAKAEYIANKNIGLEEIAKKYGTTYLYLQKVSSKEGWKKEKDERWDRAEKNALDEIEGGIKDLIVRHGKIARYFQSAGVKYIKVLLDEVEEKFKAGDEEGARKLLKTLMHNKIITGSNLIKMVAEGWKAERELYPKQMKVEGDVGVRLDEASDLLVKTAHEALIRELTKRPAGKNTKHTRDKKA